MLSTLALLLAPILVSASPIFLPSEPATCEASREVSREATPSEDELPRWQREPSGPFLDCYDNFRLAGFAPAEANRLAHIGIYGTEPSAGSEGCHYYVVTVYYCEGDPVATGSSTWEPSASRIWSGPVRP